MSEKLEEQLVLSRGITEKEQIKSFLEPNYDDLHDPFILLDMERAVSRILSAIGDGEKIILFGDYDADGVCGVAIFHDFFKKIGFENFSVMIPDRNKEGYGLNMEAVRSMGEEKGKLLITVDCGITDFNEVREAKKIGIETIIVDHHLELETLPEAHSIVDPRIKRENYPCKMLAGTGVAFKVVQALVRRGGFNITPGWEKWLLDLVAVATIADMVPLTGENRVLAYFGLMVLNKTNRAGFLSFFKKFNLTPGKVVEDDVSFTIAPRINIASRMDHANASYSLVTTESAEESEWIIDHFNKLNQERREVVEQILKEVEGRMADHDAVESHVMVEGDAKWNPGVLGLVANRLMERYKKPVFIWGKGESDVYKGSARSTGSVNLVELMKLLDEGLLLEYGGHALSAGFSLEEEKTGVFRTAVESVFTKIKVEEKEDILWIDDEIIIDEIDWRFLKKIGRLAPFGQGNPKPIFLLRNLEVYDCKMFGNGGIHMKLDFKKSGGGVISAVGFFMKKEEPEKIGKGMVLDLAVSVERNTFRGKDELRLRIIDLRKAGAPAYD